MLRSYRLSTYRAGTVTARIGWRPDGLDGRSRVPLVLLSACNPGGRRRPDGWNRRMMRRLDEAMRRVAHVAGEGRLGRWSEPLVLAAVAPARGIVLARRFRQNAVVVLQPRRPARLMLLGPRAAGPVPDRRRAGIQSFIRSDRIDRTDKDARPGGHAGA